jgi:hypothetical protein
VAEEQGQGIAVQGAVELRVEAQGAQLRGEDQPRPAIAAQAAHEERLLAQAVAQQGQAARARIPQGQGEHAVQARQGVLKPPLLNGRQQDLGVRVAPEAMAQGLQCARSKRNCRFPPLKQTM